ncbi:hypothetical protein DM860_013159 [Cuscuta australis]|uniref:Uncharacterized protein n=1 Tax=Cuscuta australis TaxID=267555 RepID=A0A328D7D4_9ASTE|nr:hypothetical protein DM860_013159 [Cuscuta australis]
MDYWLRPDLKSGNFTEAEDKVIINLHSILGDNYLHTPFSFFLFSKYISLVSN